MSSETYKLIKGLTLSAIGGVLLLFLTLGQVSIATTDSTITVSGLVLSHLTRKKVVEVVKKPKETKPLYFFITSPR